MEIENTDSLKTPLVLWAYSEFRYRTNKRTRLKNVAPNVEILPEFRSGSKPTFADPTSQTCTASQIFEPEYLVWCQRLRSHQRLHRKQWEHLFILQVLNRSGVIGPGARGVGFGCGTEPIVAWLATRGCSILATDMHPDQVVGTGWAETHQYAFSKDALNLQRLCDRETFERNVVFRHVDMNAIPEDIRNFDFTWSSCALEHLGSLDHGFDFIKNSARCLKPGGIAVHTTEINLSSNTDTLEDRDCVIYRKRDIEAFSRECLREGIELNPVNWQTISEPIDEVLDLPPYRECPHIKIRLGKYVNTSIGLVLRKSH